MIKIRVNAYGIPHAISQSKLMPRGDDVMIKLNYGKYTVPESLDKIIELQKQLHEEGLLDHGDLLGYYFSHEGLDSRYLNTPLDVISFATPGSDGIHYGFLTDFGQVEDLEKAYIVRVSPMDFDEPVKIVARNIDDFMRILCFSPIVLDLVDISTSESDFKKYPELSTDNYTNVGGNQVGEILRETFQLEPIEFIRDYLQKVKRERENEIVLSSADGIGVVNKKQHTKNGVK